MRKKYPEFAGSLLVNCWYLLLNIATSCVFIAK